MPCYTGLRMGYRLGSAIRGLWTFVFSTLGLLISMPKRLFWRIWLALSAVASRLASQSAKTTRSARSLLSQVTMFFQRLFGRFVRRPVLWLKRSVVRLARASWAFIGRLGLALHQLLAPHALMQRVGERHWQYHPSLLQHLRQKLTLHHYT